MRGINVRGVDLGARHRRSGLRYPDFPHDGVFTIESDYSKLSACYPIPQISELCEIVRGYLIHPCSISLGDGVLDRRMILAMKNQKRRRDFETKDAAATDRSLSDGIFIVDNDFYADFQARGEATRSHLPSPRN
jgi:hypothetical protein